MHYAYSQKGGRYGSLTSLKLAKFILQFKFNLLCLKVMQILNIHSHKLKATLVEAFDTQELPFKISLEGHNLGSLRSTITLLNQEGKINVTTQVKEGYLEVFSKSAPTFTMGGLESL